MPTKKGALQTNINRAIYAGLPGSIIYNPAKMNHFVQPGDNADPVAGDTMLLTNWTLADYQNVLGLLLYFGDRFSQDNPRMRDSAKADIASIKQAYYRLLDAMPITFVPLTTIQGTSGIGSVAIMPDTTTPGQFNIQFIAPPDSDASAGTNPNPKTIHLGNVTIDETTGGTASNGTFYVQSETSTDITYGLNIHLSPDIDTSGGVTWLNPLNPIEPSLLVSPSLSIDTTTGQLTLTRGSYQPRITATNAYDNTISAPLIAFDGTNQILTLSRPTPTAPPIIPPPPVPTGSTTAAVQCNVSASIANYMNGKIAAAIADIATGSGDTLIRDTLVSVFTPVGEAVGLILLVKAFVDSVTIASINTGFDATVKAFMLCDLYALLENTHSTAVNPTIVTQWAADLAGFSGTTNEFNAAQFVSYCILVATANGKYSYDFQRIGATYYTDTADCSGCPEFGVIGTFDFTTSLGGWAIGDDPQWITDLTLSHPYVYIGGRYAAGSGILSTANYPPDAYPGGTGAGENEVANAYITGVSIVGRYVRVRSIRATGVYSSEAGLWVSTASNSVYHAAAPAGFSGSLFYAFPDPATGLSYSELTFDLGTDETILAMQLMVAVPAVYGGSAPDASIATIQLAVLA